MCPDWLWALPAGRWWRTSTRWVPATCSKVCTSRHLQVLLCSKLLGCIDRVHIMVISRLECLQKLCPACLHLSATAEPAPVVLANSCSWLLRALVACTGSTACSNGRCSAGQPLLTSPTPGALQDSRHRLARSTKRTAAVLQEEMSDGGDPDDMADEMQGGDDDDMEEEVFGEQMRRCTHLSP